MQEQKGTQRQGASSRNLMVRGGPEEGHPLDHAVQFAKGTLFAPLQKQNDDLLDPFRFIDMLLIARHGAIP